ncbi:MAG: PAS domain-containing protein [Sulfuritalea sp.]|nr:PAS domain-containing protein [Sulfuritalea sp.]
MIPAAPPFQAHMDIVYFVYGLAFFSLGLTILLRNERSSNLKVSGILWLLAAFGFIHGFLEWTDLWRMVRGDTPGLVAARPVILLASFLFLFEFGRRLVLVSQPAGTWTGTARRLLSPWIYAPMLTGILVGVIGSDQPLPALTIWSRYLLGFFGASLAGAGCYLYGKNHVGADRESSDFPGLHRAWYVAAAAFVAYGILGGVIVPRADWFPASAINNENFLATFLIPVQLLRAICAVTVAVSVGKLLRIFWLEDQRKLRRALDIGQIVLAELYRIRPGHEAILELVTDGIVGMDRNGNVIFVNDAALSMLDYQRAELIGKPFHELIHHTTTDGKPYPVEDCPILRAMRTHSMQQVDEDLFWRKNGTWFTVEYRVAPLLQGNRIQGAVVVFNDITEVGRSGRRFPDNPR